MQNETQETTEEVKAQAEEAVLEETEAETSVKEEKEQKEEESFKEKFFYLAAEMQNLQKRFDKEKQDLLKYGNEKILSGLLEVLDNFDRTLGFIKNDEDHKVKNIVVGIEMIAKQFFDLLERNGLKKVEALGKQFDPNFHEALGEEACEGKENGEIIKVQQEGYELNGRLLRAAKVTVCKNEEK